jgi:hypothetical protein
MQSDDGRGGSDPRLAYGTFTAIPKAGDDASSGHHS